MDFECAREVSARKRFRPFGLCEAAPDFGALRPHAPLAVSRARDAERSCGAAAPGRPVRLSAALVDDLLRAAVAAADDLLVLHFLVADDRQRVVLHALLLELGLDLGLELVAGLS